MARGEDARRRSAARGAGKFGLRARGLRFLRQQRRVVARLVLWSVLETAQTFLMGYALARALDEGFLRGRAGVGLGWLGVAALAVAVGAYGTRRVYEAVAALVEPLRDRLVERVVARGVREADGGALSALTQQVEIARDTFAGVVMVSRSFVFTAGGALIGLASLAPPLLLVVAPPLVLGVGLFAASMRPLARRQETFLVADEALADRFGEVCAGLRDVTASGAEKLVAADVGDRVEAELRAARSLARWGVPRVASIAVGGQLPLVLLLLTAPWLLRQGVTPGALVGALAYVTQSLLPALQNLVHGMGTSGSRLAVVLRRLVPPGRAGVDGSGPAPCPAPSLKPAPIEAPGPTPSPSPARAPTPSEAPAPTPAALPAPTPSRPSRAPVPRSTPTEAPAPAPTPALTVSGLTFAYGPACAPVVDDLTLSLPAGTRLAVVGPSGIGKSTLVSLAAGLLDPRRGAIRLCGHPVPGGAARAHRVVIPQEAYVFSGTFAENLGCLRPKPVPEAELLAAAEAVGLTALLDRHGGPQGQVDPAALSAGERQLIALTRAFLSYACVAFLDEATCHLDPEAEERAERAFAARPGTTLVVVAHRIASARRADRVLVMDGRECAYGTHDELLERSSLYRDLVGSWSAEPPVPSQPALALRDADGVDAVTGPGLTGDGRHVVAHGSVGQMQAAGDLRDGRPVRGE
ncbi:ATP-binding cassette domain-containing protein [Streptomyces sp. ME02-8801-2C]|uniref:ATP-binding cassette domain-containing protein n=1 Tax=Streptomyces sp. ME02-8801-2C TaxID=3028680 RepID=UPI0029B4EEBA|nr:ATP-binding cassette domain-containing protein [Streptomyces sp. ME02-8801-2C]MDX3457002.1 ATP-binding cassette domain-containing protein [Streptomyces sp. ME02-8801-2C]